MDIRNMPDEAANYEFVVAMPNGDHYTFLGMYANGHQAENEALMYGGVVIHNVRIHGYQPPTAKKRKYYSFSGSWSWGCWAESEKEARSQFEHTYYDEVDIDFDHIKIEIETEED